MFSKAIVRMPCKNLVSGLTSANLGKPDYDKAIIQHQNYVKALQKCGLDVLILEPDEDFPDSTFVEDTALLTPHCAIITNPGASSRKDEVLKIKNELKKHFSNSNFIQDPGTLEAGDVFIDSNRYYGSAVYGNRQDTVHFDNYTWETQSKFQVDVLYNGVPETSWSPLILPVPVSSSERIIFCNLLSRISCLC